MDFILSIFNKNKSTDKLHTDTVDKENDTATDSDSASQSIPEDHGKYKRDENDNLIFISEEHKLNGDVIRRIDDSPRTGPDGRPSQSHIVIAITGHGTVLPSTLPAGLSDNVVIWSLASPNGTAMAYPVAIKEEFEENEKPQSTDATRTIDIVEVIIMYAKKLLTEGYPILNVLNALRQNFTRQKKVNPTKNPNKENKKNLRERSTPMSLEEVLRRYNRLKLGYGSHLADLATKGIADSVQQGADTNLNASTNELIEHLVESTMVLKNKYAYIHIPTHDHRYTSSVYTPDDLAQTVLPTKPDNVEVRVLDVRYPTTADQLTLNTPEGKDEITRNVSKFVPLKRGFARHQAKLSEIITYLKAERGFDYVTIIETSCRSKEIDLNVAYSPGEEHIDALHQSSLETTVQHYAQQRNDANRFIKKVGYGRFGGSRPKRSRRGHKSKRSARYTRRRRGLGKPTLHRVSRRRIYTTI